MKKILYCFLSFAALSMVSCDMNNPNEDKFDGDPQKDYVEFAYEATTVLTGSTTQFTVPVVLEAPVNKGLTVNFTITDVEGTTAGYVSHTGKASIPSGQLTGNLVFNIPQTALTSCTTFEITLTGTSRDNVELGFNGEGQLTHTVVLGLGRDSFLGTYDVLEDGEFEYEAVVTAGEAPNELVIANLFDVDPDSQTRIFLNSSGSANNNVVFPLYDQNYLFTSNNPAQGDVYISNDFEGIQGISHIGSSFDSCDLTLNLNFFLLFGPGQDIANPDGGAINAVFTKQ